MVSNRRFASGSGCTTHLLLTQLRSLQSGMRVHTATTLQTGVQCYLFVMTDEGYQACHNDRRCRHHASVPLQAHLSSNDPRHPPEDHNRPVPNPLLWASALIAEKRVTGQKTAQNYEIIALV